VRLLEASPAAAFYASDLLKAHSAQSVKHRQAILERLMWHLSSASSPTDAQLFAPAHLAAVLLSEVAPSRETAAEKGEPALAGWAAQLCLWLAAWLSLLLLLLAACPALFLPTGTSTWDGSCLGHKITSLTG
jgi:hypothetical protein